MKEIEVKILEVDRAEVAQRLEVLKADHHFDGWLMATFYDFPDGRIRRAGDVLRLRTEGHETMLTYKRRISKEEAKIMEEQETRVASREATHAILTQLGMQPIKETRKHRAEYILEGSKVVIDDYEGDLGHIPVFLEVESPDLESLRRIVGLLGFREADCKNWSTEDLALHYASTG